MPTFNGESIFGGQVRMSRSGAERAGQRNEYGGLNGKEFLDMGDRGLFTNVTGNHYFATAYELNAAQLLFDSYRDGNVYELVDTLGNAWGNVLLDEFTMTGPIQRVAGSGGYRQTYQAKFEHLTNS